MFNRIVFSVFVILTLTLSACTSDGEVGGPGGFEIMQTAPPATPEDAPGSEAKQTDSPATAEIVALGEVTSMRVLWTVSQYVLGKDYLGDEGSIKAYLAKPLDINETEIIFDGQVCKGVVFQQEPVEAVDYLSTNWRETPQSLGIEGLKVEVIKTNCGLFGFKEYLRLEDRRLIVPFQGTYYFFDPFVNY